MQQNGIKAHGCKNVVIMLFFETASKLASFPDHLLPVSGL